MQIQWYHGQYIDSLCKKWKHVAIMGYELHQIVFRHEISYHAMSSTSIESFTSFFRYVCLEIQSIMSEKCINALKLPFAPDI